MIETSEVTVSIPQLLLEAALVYDMGKKVKSRIGQIGGRLRCGTTSAG